MATETEKLRFRKALMASTDKYVKQQGRNTMALNAEKDAACAGYARVPGPDACSFCVTVASGREYFSTSKAAGHSAYKGGKYDRYHPYCNCSVVMVFKRRGQLVARDVRTGDAVPYDREKIRRRYAELGSPTFATKRKAVVTGKAAKASKAKVRSLGAKQAGEFRKMLDEASTLNELLEVGAEIERRIPNAKRKGAYWKSLQRTATLRKSRFEREARLSSVVNGGSVPPVEPPSGGGNNPGRFRSGREIQVDGIFGEEKSTWEISYRGEVVKLFVPESSISNEVIFAGYHTSTPFRNAELLARLYGGDSEKWFHSSGVAWLFDPKDGRIRKAEIHWCEEETVGIHEIVLKNWLS